MAITVGEFLAVIEKLAPADLAEDWDACGLQVGADDIESDSILLTLNVTPAVVEEAAAAGSNIILTHHPLIFRPLDAVSDASGPGRLVRAATRAGIAVIAAHTNLDAAPGGLADMMAEMLELEEVEPVAAASRGRLHKLVVFVPQKDLGPVRKALFEAGAGVIGNYEHCSWYTSGTGTFLPMEGADPAIGEVGTDESVDEYRLETLVSVDDLDKAVAAMVAAHSYEEPAYDIYPLVTIDEGTAAGRVGRLSRMTSLADLSRLVGERFQAGELRFTGQSERAVERVAVVPGSGAGFIGVVAGRADALVTGDFKYHDSFEAEEAGVGLVELPHDLSEAAALSRWMTVLENELAARGVGVTMSSAPTDNWKRVGSEKEATGGMEVADMGGSYKLHVDGGARGNPGPAGIGAVLTGAGGERIASLSETIGEATNNIAEYRALIAGVELALSNGVNELDIYSDSELIVKQLEGSYRVKNAGLKPLHGSAMEALARLEGYRLHVIPREENADADALVNQALDEQG